MAYPRRAVRRGDLRADVVAQVQARLDAIGCGPLKVDGDFGDDTESSVRLFQTRRNLEVDGVIGPMTWNELFAEGSDLVDQPPTGILKTVLDIALSQEGVRETGRNRGREVDEYISRVGLKPDGAFPWCQAFVYWCFDEAALKVGITNPVVRTARVLAHWKEAPVATRVEAERALDDPSLIRPGAIFVVDHGAGKGHTGIVTKVFDGKVGTIEGNTNKAGSREGDGVYQKVRTITSLNIGFVDYGR